MGGEKLVPKLRFSGFDEFSNKTSWSNYFIKNACDVITGFPFKSKNYVEDGKYKVVRGDNVKSGFIRWNEKTRCWNEITKQLEEYKLKENDIIIGMDGSKVGRNWAIITKNDLPSLLAQRVACIRANNKFNQNYLKQIFFNDKFIRYVDSVKTGTSIFHISKKQIEDFKFSAPPLEEQEKIAKFLSTIDYKIKLLKKKYESYVNFKKYLMQQIFTQKLRFAEDSEWKTVTINDLFDNITDYVAAGSFADIKKNVEYKSEPNYAQLVRTVDLKKNFANNDEVYVDEHAFEYLWRVNLNEKCIVLPNIGANIGEIYFINPKDLPYKNNVLAPNAILLKSDENIVFKYYLLSTTYFKNQLNVINESSGQPKFNKTSLKKIKIEIPNNNIEKDKIANFLTNIDIKIKEYNNKIKLNEEFKNGLLQQMFV